MLVLNSIHISEIAVNGSQTDLMKSNLLAFLFLFVFRRNQQDYHSIW